MEMVDNRQGLMKMLVKELGFTEKQVRHVIQLTEEGNTVPFIARYRKEWTGSLDEVQIRAILERWQYMMQLEDRKEEVLRLIGEKGKLTEELRRHIVAATKLQEVEDLYRPYKEKRRTKATIAKEKGLEPLAEWLLLYKKENPAEKAMEFVNAEKEVASAEDALQGAQDIIAELVSDNAAYRSWIRNTTFRKGIMSSSVKDKEKDEKNIYEMYYGYEEPLQKVVPHRVLAMNRGEKEDVLRISVITPIEEILQFLHKK